jgi:hypothetical protein
MPHQDAEKSDGTIIDALAQSQAEQRIDRDPIRSVVKPTHRPNVHPRPGVSAEIRPRRQSIGKRFDIEPNALHRRKQRIDPSSTHKLL